MDRELIPLLDESDRCIDNRGGGERNDPAVDRSVLLLSVS